MSLNLSHIPYTQLVDWVEGRLPGEQRTALAAHLDACARCRTEAALITRMLAAMRADASVDAPPAVIARAVNLFRARAVEPAPSLLQRLVAALTSESAPLTPAFGLRSTEATVRRLIFTASDYDIDLRVTPVAPGWQIAGQVLGPDAGTGEAVLTLADRTITASLDDNAAFTFPPLPAGKAALTLRCGAVELVIEEFSIGRGE